MGSLSSVNRNRTKDQTAIYSSGYALAARIQNTLLRCSLVCSISKLRVRCIRLPLCCYQPTLRQISLNGTSGNTFSHRAARSPTVRPKQLSKSEKLSKVKELKEGAEPLDLRTSLLNTVVDASVVPSR